MENDLLLTAGCDGKLIAWNMPDLTLHSEVLITNCNDPITSLFHLREENTLLIGTLGARLLSLNLTTGRLRKSSSKHFELIDKLQITPDSNTIIASGQDLFAETFNRADHAFERNISGPTDDFLTDICVSPKGNSLFMATISGSLIEKDLNTGTVKHRISTTPSFGFTFYRGGTASLAIDEVNELLLVGGYQLGQVKAFRLSNLDCIRIWELPNSHSSPRRAPITAILTLPEENEMLYGDASGFIATGSYDSDDVTKFWNNQNSAVTLLTQLSPETFLAGYRNGMVELYDISTKTLLKTSPAHAGMITGATPVNMTNLILQNTIIEQKERFNQQHSTSKCHSCEKDIETSFWFCPECFEQIYLSRCPSCRKKFRSEYEGNHGKCSYCGYNPRYGDRFW